jgi:hypothetical protein
LAAGAFNLNPKNAEYFFNSQQWPMSGAHDDGKSGGIPRWLAE